MRAAPIVSTVLGAAVLAAILLVAMVIQNSGALPNGPVAAVWDHEACAFCRMHVGEPGFAAQLQTVEGDVLFFDDPGCLFELLDKGEHEVHALYFHHYQEDRWIPGTDVAFLDVTPTPMGYGIAAVAVGTPGAVSIENARAKVRATAKDR